MTDKRRFKYRVLTWRNIDFKEIEDILNVVSQDGSRILSVECKEAKNALDTHLTVIVEYELAIVKPDEHENNAFYRQPLKERFRD